MKNRFSTSVLAFLVSSSAVAMDYTLNNDKLSMSFNESNATFVIQNQELGHKLSPSELFFITFEDETKLHEKDFKIKEINKGDNRISVHYSHPDFNVIVKLNALKDKYASIDYSIEATDKEQKLKKITFFPTKKQSQAPYVNGSINSSPIIADSFFILPDKPIINTYAYEGTTNLSVEIKTPIQPKTSVSYTVYFGTFPENNQLRRSVNLFIDALRPRQYKPYLHYNSWMDIGFFTPYTEEDVLKRMKEWDKFFISGRGIKLDAFLLDDGWDDLSGKWLFGEAFKNGFSKVREKASSMNSSVGLWLSPWGGYNIPREKRVANAKKNGFETIDGKFALSGPNYFKNFNEKVLNLIQNEHITSFKLDGMGNANSYIKGSPFASDFDASIVLIENMRKANPNQFINLTTGTNASPSWLFYADSIWRQGDDVNLHGPGDAIQQWLTYRDAETYRSIVRKGPLFPLNSLMYHGIISASNAYYGLEKVQTDSDFADQVWSYFASGTQLQELYITPSMLNDTKWDTLAQAAKWSHDNANVLIDTHWIGGDPTILDVYGWASWAEEKSIFALRNPSDEPQSYYLNLTKDLEIPKGKNEKFMISLIYGNNETIPKNYTQATVITLAPFETVVLEATPF